MKNKIKFKIEDKSDLTFDIIMLFNNIIIGECSIEKTDYGFYIIEFKISSKYRNKGYGHIFMKECINILKNMRKYDFYIDLVACPIPEINEEYSVNIKQILLKRLLKFYRYFGFKIINQNLDSASMVLDIIRW